MIEHSIPATWLFIFHQVTHWFFEECKFYWVSVGFDGLNYFTGQDEKKLLQRLDKYSQPWSNIQSQPLGYLFFVKSLTDSKKYVNFIYLLLVLTVWITSRVKMGRNCFKGWINIRSHDRTFNPSHLVIFHQVTHWFFEECNFYWVSVGFDGLN